MGDVVDLAKVRAAAEAPDAEFVRADEYGRHLYTYLLSYEHEGHSYGAEIIAYSMDDAAAKVGSMLTSLSLTGQAMAVIPA